MKKATEVERLSIKPAELFEFLWMARRYAIGKEERAWVFDRIYCRMLSMNPWVIREKPESIDEYQEIIPWASKKGRSWCGLPLEVKDYWEFYQRVGYKLPQLNQYCEEKEELSYRAYLDLSRQDFFTILNFARLYASGRDTYAPGMFNAVYGNMLRKNSWILEEAKDEEALAFPLAYRLSFGINRSDWRAVYQKAKVEIGVYVYTLEKFLAEMKNKNLIDFFK